jgi:thiol-disulfide isomerase/thioredoxin
VGRRARLVVGLTLLALAGGAGAAAAQGPRPGQAAPEITAGRWINSPPLTIDGLRGRVVLVEFWTFGCYNCKNVIPTLREWHARYAAHGLTIVGVHCPEFTWERPFDKVVGAVRDLAIRYAVVQDNDFAVWTRYGVRAWPTLVLVDKRGVVRYRHIGEGAYEDTEARIRRLLAEGS